MTFNTASFIFGAVSGIAASLIAIVIVALRAGKISRKE